MNITYTARNTVLKDDFKERAQKKVDKYDRLFEDANTTVVVTQEQIRFTVEITIRGDGMIYRAEDTSTEVMEALDNALSRLSRQISKQRSKLRDKFRTGSLDDISDYIPNFEDQTEEEDFKIVRYKTFNMKPVFVEEAVLQMNLLGHDFFIFNNADTGQVNAVYKRHHGDYGLIEPEY